MRRLKEERRLLDSQLEEARSHELEACSSADSMRQELAGERAQHSRQLLQVGSSAVPMGVRQDVGPAASTENDCILSSTAPVTPSAGNGPQAAAAAPP